MPPFHIYSHDTLIGWSELELGDAPMAVASGVLVPSEAYGSFQARVVASTEANQDFLRLSARLHDGTRLQAVGVCITDYSAELGADGIEVSVLGISHPPYTQLFPNHVAAYEQQFPEGV